MSVGARALVERALAAHGGREAWRSAEWVSARVWCGGPAFWPRLAVRPLDGAEVRVATHGQRVLIRDWPRPGHWGEFTGDAAWVSDHAGRIVAARTDPGRVIAGRRHRLAWDRLDLLTFLGMSLWTYLSLPFALDRPGVRVQDAGPTGTDGAPRHRLRAILPPGAPAHSRELVVHLDEEGRMRRLDYTAEAVDARARVAHHLLDLRASGGLVWPARRRVVPRARSGRALRGPELVWIRMDAVRLTG